MNLRLDHLRLLNFRCFGECAVTFHPSVTILVADNGGGKTTILDAASTVLAQFVDELTGFRQSDGISKGDVRLARGEGGSLTPRIPTQLDVKGAINDVEVRWTCLRKQYDKPARRAPTAVVELFESVGNLRSRLEAAMPGGAAEALPVVAYYGSDRFTDSGYFGKKRKKRRYPPEDRLSGYRMFLNPLSESLYFNEWYERMFTAVKSHTVTGEIRQDSPLRQLTAVRTAVNRVLKPSKWRDIDWDEKQQSVVAEHPIQGRMPLGALSSGVRNIIALTADLAHRCARLNPALGEGAACTTPGVVLIDEVDLHLHPSWQQQVVDLLQGAFPTIQFILSTHSPQVLSTVKAESIRVIKLSGGAGKVETPKFQTRGVESANVLSTIMGVDPVPKVEEAEQIHRYRVLIDDGENDGNEGTELRVRLLRHFGPQHPLMLDCDRLIRFNAFKRRSAGGD